MMVCTNRLESPVPYPSLRRWPRSTACRMVAGRVSTCSFSGGCSVSARVSARAKTSLRLTRRKPPRPATRGLSRAERAVEPFLRQPRPRRRFQFDGDAARGNHRAQLVDLLVDHAFDFARAERTESDD